MTILNAWLIFFAGTAWGLGPKAPEALDQVRSTLTPAVILPGERAKLRVELPLKLLRGATPSAEGDEEQLPSPRQDDRLLLQGKGYGVLKQNFFKENDLFVWSYEITGYLPGKIRLPPISIAYEDQTFSSEALMLEISPHRAEGDEELKEAFDAVRAPFPWGKFAWGLGLIALGVLLVVSLGYKKKLLLKMVAFITQPTLKDRWVQELRAIETAVQQNKTDWALERIAFLYRLSLEKVKHQPGLAWTAREITNHTTKTLPMVPWLQRYEGHLFASSPMNPITAREFALEGLRHLKNSVSLLSLMGKKAPW